ncbi:hypothetical protein VO56_02200 [Mycoplasmopsis gallinacea]|uniref:Uncharacterized protein n=1 Tax=Mycoplasmopsis gallinacea TaxID=29556 RepID=A0A0D5ZK77_9BACT|nr:hypothetical protein VO56_02200 [Mycoplasmopsis gallinacea]
MKKIKIPFIVCSLSSLTSIPIVLSYKTTELKEYHTESYNFNKTISFNLSLNQLVDRSSGTIIDIYRINLTRKSFRAHNDTLSNILRDIRIIDLYSQIQVLKRSGVEEYFDNEELIDWSYHSGGNVGLISQNRFFSNGDFPYDHWNKKVISFNINSISTKSNFDIITFNVNVSYSIENEYKQLERLENKINEELKKLNSSNALENITLLSQSGENSIYGTKTNRIGTTQTVVSNNQQITQIEERIKQVVNSFNDKPENLSVYFENTNKFNQKRIVFRFTNINGVSTTHSKNINYKIINAVEQDIQNRISITPGAYIDKSNNQKYTPILEEKVVNGNYETFPTLTYTQNPERNEILYINDQAVPIIDRLAIYEFKDLKNSNVGETKLNALLKAREKYAEFERKINELRRENKEINSQDTRKLEELKKERDKKQAEYDNLNKFKIEVKSFDPNSKIEYVVYSKTINVVSQKDQIFEISAFAWNPKTNEEQKLLIEKYLKDPNGKYLLDNNNQRILNPKFNPNINKNTGTNAEIVVIGTYRNDANTIRPFKYFPETFFNLQDPLKPNGQRENLSQYQAEKGKGQNLIIAEAHVVYGGIKFDLGNSDWNKISVIKLEDNAWKTNVPNQIDWNSKLDFFKNKNNVFSDKGIWLFSLKGDKGLAKHKIVYIKDPIENNNSAINDELFSKLVKSSKNIWEHYWGKHLETFLKIKYNYNTETIHNLDYDVLIGYWKEYFNLAMKNKTLTSITPTINEDIVKNFALTHFEPKIVASRLIKMKNNPNYELSLPFLSSKEQNEYLNLILGTSSSFERDIQKVKEKFASEIKKMVSYPYPEFIDCSVSFESGTVYKVVFYFTNKSNFLTLNTNKITVAIDWLKPSDQKYILPELIGNNLRNYLIRNKITKSSNSLKTFLNILNSNETFFTDNTREKMNVISYNIEQDRDNQNLFRISIKFEIKNDFIDAYSFKNKNNEIVLSYDLTTDVSGEKIAIQTQLNNDVLKNYLIQNGIKETTFENANKETFINTLNQRTSNFFTKSFYKYANVSDFSIRKNPENAKYTFDIILTLKEEFRENYTLINDVLHLDYSLDNSNLKNEARFNLNGNRLYSWLIKNKAEQRNYQSEASKTEFKLFLNNPLNKFLTSESYQNVRIVDFQIKAIDPTYQNKKKLILYFDVVRNKKNELKISAFNRTREIVFDINDAISKNEFDINGIFNIENIPFIDIKGEVNLTKARERIKNEIVNENPLIEKEDLFISDRDVMNVINNKNQITTITVKSQSLSLNDLNNQGVSLEVHNTIDPSITIVPENANLNSYKLEKLKVQGITTIDALKETIINHLNNQLSKHKITFEQFLEFENELYLNSLLKPNSINRIRIYFLPKNALLVEKLALDVENDLTNVSNTEYDPYLDTNNPDNPNFIDGTNINWNSNSGEYEEETNEVEKDKVKEINESKNAIYKKRTTIITSIISSLLILSVIGAGIAWFIKRNRNRKIK